MIIIKSTLRFLSPSQQIISRRGFPVHLLNAQVYLHTNIKQRRQSFQKKIVQSLKEIQQEVFDLKEHYEYFQNLNWKVEFHKVASIMQFTCNRLGYELKVLCPVKARLNRGEEKGEDGIKLEQEALAERAFFNEVTVLIRKEDTSKWMISEFIILDDKVQRVTLFFEESSESPALRVNYQHKNSNSYPGPDLSSMEIELMRGINDLTQQLGITGQLLINIAVLTANQERSLVTDWLQNMKSIL